MKTQEAQVEDLIQLWVLDKENQPKPKASKRKDIIKMKVQIGEI